MMNSNIRRHTIHYLKCDAKKYVARLLRKEGYVGSDNDLLADAMFDAHGIYLYNPVYFRQFWQVECLPAILAVLTPPPNQRYGSFEDYQTAVRLARSFIRKQIKQRMYW